MKETNTPRPGHNQTGAAIHPERLAAMQSGPAELAPEEGSTEAAHALRVERAREAPPHGTMPPIAEVRPGILPLLDKLGARIAFERAGTRLWEGVLVKLDAHGSWPGGPTRAEVAAIRDEEQSHMLFLSGLVRSLGGDPTAITPSASVQLTAGRGVLDVILDPGTSLVESLDAALVAELADNESWHHLGALVQSVLRDVPGVAPAAAGDGAELTLRFAEAARAEATHLERVRTWLSAAEKLSLGETPPGVRAPASREHAS